MSAARIVLVEDDDSIRMITQLALESIGGYEVTAFSSGADALRDAPALNPSLFVLDVAMPGMDGRETLERMRATRSLATTPVVFLTANTQPGQVNDLHALGAVDIIAKPFDPDHLCGRVAAALAGARRSVPADDAQQVLVIEDDAGTRYLLRFILEQHGWTVSEAISGPEAVAAIGGAVVPQAVLLDIMLPEIDGLDVLDALRRCPAWSRVPVMMLSARGDETAVRRALANGANDYLGKPFDPSELVTRLRRLTSS